METSPLLITTLALLPSPHRRPNPPGKTDPNRAKPDLSDLHTPPPPPQEAPYRQT